MTPCARLHAVPGEHTPPCTCTRECPDHDGHCTGCLPVEATRGLLCARCAQILEGFLGAEEGLADDPEQEVHGLPWAWEQLGDAYPSLTQAPSSGGRSGSYADPEAERLTAVLAVRDDIHATLAQWTQVLTEQAGLTGPDLGVMVTATPDKARARVQGIQVSRYANWLLRHIDPLLAGTGVAATDLDVAAMLIPGHGRIEPPAEDVEQHLAELRAEQVRAVWDELADLMSRAHALAPWRPAPTKLEGIPCRCGAVELHDHGDEILCWACRRSLTREEYRVATVVFARRFADDERGHRAVQRPRLETSSTGAGGRA